MWFPMQVGSDERRFAWQDEGLTRFNQAQGMQAFFKGYDREAHRARQLSRARAHRRRSAADAARRPVSVRTRRRTASRSYDKMATNMVALRALLGDEAFLSSVSHVRAAVAVQASDAIRLL